MLCRRPWEALMEGKERARLCQRHLPWLQCWVHPLDLATH